MEAKVVLAPMSGVTDLSFRLMCRGFGAEVCFFEMLDANALLYNHPATLRLIKTNTDDKAIAAQLLGNDASIIRDAAHRLLRLVNISFLDINCACPAKKVIKKKAGAYLLRDRKKLGTILKKLTSSLEIPVTAKIRIGFDRRDAKEFLNIAKTCEDSGLSTVFVHGRTKQAGYSGPVDYEAIRLIKSKLKIPVYGSGNVFDPLLAKKMFDDTGCDGILVARGAQGNPWIFKDIKEYLQFGKVSKPPLISVKKMLLKKHLGLVKKHKEMKESSKIGFMRKIAMWYLKGLPGATKIRDDICKSTKEYGDLIGLIEAIET